MVHRAANFGRGRGNRGTGVWSWRGRRLLLWYSWVPRLGRRGWWSRLVRSRRLDLADWPWGKTRRQRGDRRRSRCVARRRRPPLLAGNNRRLLCEDALQYGEEVEDGGFLPNASVQMSLCSTW